MRSLAETVSGGVLVQRGAEVVFASTEAASILGIDPDAVAGESWTTLVPAAERST